MKKYIYTALFLAILLVTPAFADSIADQIAALRAQIAQLTEQLNQLLAQERKNFCFRFDRDFRSDDVSNPDWTKMGQVLRLEGVGSVKELQEKYADDILRPSGLRLGTGYVGPSTRALLNRLYKCPITNNQAPVISGISGPTTLKVGEIGTWTIKAYDLSASTRTLNYSVLWGDESVKTEGSLSFPPSSTASLQTSTFTHIYRNPGTYNPTFTVTNSSNQSAHTSLSVNVSPNQTQSITVLSPNGGETWVASTTQDIKWSWPNAKRTDKVDLYLTRDWSCPSGLGCAAVMPEPIVLDKNISARATAYHWLVASEINSNEITIPGGQYRVRICQAGSQSNCDSSDTAFTISR